MNFSLSLRKAIFMLLLSFILNGLSHAQKSLPYQDKTLSVEKRVNDLINRMTLDEKIKITAGMRVLGKGWQKNDWDGTPEIPRLGIPKFEVIHGPHGINPRNYSYKGTYYPTGITMASTWNRELVEKAANSIAKELAALNGHANAGPGVNIIRDLRGGRSFEYLSEDPFLNGAMATAYVKGFQKEKRVAILKHFVANNQERHRNYLNVIVSERALREIYLPGFKAPITQANALGVMTGYNKVNGLYCASNKHLIQEIMKDEWGFKGVVMTDWQGSHDTVPMAKAGTDIEMPLPKHWGHLLKEAIEHKEYSERALDEKVKRILSIIFFTGAFDNQTAIDPTKVNTKASVELSRKVAEEGIILLKNNDNFLPLDKEKVKKIAVIGPTGAWGSHFRNGAANYQLYQGGGSASIPTKTKDLITPVMGLQKLVGTTTAVNFKAGCTGDNGQGVIATKYLSYMGKEGLKAEYFNNEGLKGTPQIKHETKFIHIWNKQPIILEAGDENQGGNNERFSIRYTGNITIPESRLYRFELQAIGKGSIHIDGKVVLDKIKANQGWDKFKMGEIYLEKGVHSIEMVYRKTRARASCAFLWDYENINYEKEAIKIAKEADVVLLALGTSGLLEQEAADRNERLALPKAQEHLIEVISKVNPNTIVSLYTAGVVLSKWDKQVKAILQCGFPGQQGGLALAKIIMGEINPSGKLTVSIPWDENQYPANNLTMENEIIYNEGVFVGYRYFDYNNKKVSYPFGHGLSYSKFKLEALQVPKKMNGSEEINVSVDVTNTSNIAGKTTVQLYVKDNKASVLRPEKELKAFKKIQLAPNEKKHIVFKINKQDLSFYSEAKKSWVAEKGSFSIAVGLSSQDLPLKSQFKFKP